MNIIKDYSINHAGTNKIHHPDLKTIVNGHSAVRYMRFMKTVNIDHLTLPSAVYGRWVPKVPTHPARITVSIFDNETNFWEIVQDIQLSPDPRITGEELNENMSEEQMDEYFASILKDDPFRIDLDRLCTDHLKIECDKEHPVWPNHGECNGGVYNVPFGILDPIQAHGRTLDDILEPLAYNPILKVKDIKPEAPKSMKVSDLPNMILFEGDYLSVGFSTHRPMIMHLGWDFLGKGEASKNLIMASRASYGICTQAGGLSGPLLRTLIGDFGSQNWTGEVSILGNKVLYTNLKCIEGLTLDIEITVEPDRLLFDITQNCEQDLKVLEYEAWRMAFNQTADVTSMAAVPTMLPGRNGDIKLPGMWTNNRTGCLSCKIDNKDEMTRFQVESYTKHRIVTGGVVLAKRPDFKEECMTIPQGIKHTTMELCVSTFEPEFCENAITARDGVRRHWNTVFSCFRPEFRGFSNNAISTNCHLSHGAPMDLVSRTAIPIDGPDPVELGRFTIERAILDGGGYGYHRNLYLDSDPNLICTAGRLHQVRPDIDWLKRIEPGLLDAVNRMINEIGDIGLVVCKDLSGNSESYRWSSNAMDVVGFGHIDAYVNAWSYRAFKNAQAILTDLGNNDLSVRCKSIAENIKQTYTQNLLNPETGWIAGWQSRDGQLHDYAFLFINGMAIAYGLLDQEQAFTALTNLEKLRKETGPGDARMGLPCSLIPISWKDQMLPRRRGEILPTFETYTDGSLYGFSSMYYLRALSIYGLKDQAKKLADELQEGYEAGFMHGGVGSGKEFCSWEGMPTGYEGTLIGCFASMYSIAIEQGVIKPLTPEWWPETG